MAVAEVTVVPLGTGTSSLSVYVAKALKILEDSGLIYQLTPMGTVIQGDPREIVEVVLKMHDSLFSKDIHRVVTTLKIDERRDKSLTMEGKVRAVEEKLQLG